MFLCNLAEAESIQRPQTDVNAEPAALRTSALDEVSRRFCYSFVPRQLVFDSWLWEDPMPRNVRCALIQASNALSTDRPLAQIRKAMIDKHMKLIDQAARKKAQILCLQELFYGPYFCAEQNPRWYELTERVPTVRRRV